VLDFPSSHVSIFFPNLADLISLTRIKNKIKKQVLRASDIQMSVGYISQLQGPKLTNSKFGTNSNETKLVHICTHRTFLSSEFSLKRQLIVPF
jgi:hypothetical protein